MNAATSASVAIGSTANICGATTGAVSIGYGSAACANYSITIGASSKSGATCSVALGFGVCSNRANVVTSCEFESCVAGCGLIVKTPDGTKSYRIAVDNSGNITTALA